MPLMGNLYIGASGLQTSQNALNTTAHNLSNIDTEGYSRQQVLLGTSAYNTIAINTAGISNQQIGLGVTYTAVRQVRDYFLDQTYRKESGRSAFYSMSTDALDEIQNLLGELDGVAFKNSLSDLQTAVKEIAKDPSNSVNQGLLVQRAAAFVERSQSVYSGLVSYQNNLNLQVKTNINKVNDYGSKIMDLNDQILKIEMGGAERPNDLIDSRNQLLDELGSLVNMTYAEDTDGCVSVKIEGNPFVTRGNLYEIGLEVDETTGFYNPYWPQNVGTDGDTSKAQVFDLQKKVSSELDTDIGKIKSIILARGDHQANYTELQDATSYNANISQSIVMNIQAEFDNLVHGVTTSINKILADASDKTSGYLCNEDGSPLQLFLKKNTDNYEYDTATSTWVAVAEDPTKTETLYTTMNLMINSELSQQPGKLGFIKEDKSVDYKTAAALAAAFTNASYSLNPNVTNKTNFTDYYSSLVSQVANSGYVFKSVSDNQAATVKATEAARQQITGVSSDDELTNMIKYQNAYNASSRYINVISEMLEHIISTLGS